MYTNSSTPPIKTSQTYADQLTRQEAARLNFSPQLQVAGLKHWFDYKPLLDAQDEESLVDERTAWDRLGDLYDQGLVPIAAGAIRQ